MIVTIHQPEHLPYLGLLDKINKSDIFVVLDDVYFKKNNFQNRNQILTKNGSKWLSIPVEMKNIQDKNINMRKVKNNWKDDYRNKIVDSYKTHPFFNENILWIDEMLSINSEKLIDYNMYIIKRIFDLIGINTKIVFSSELEVSTVKTQRLYDICKKLNATDYLAGQGAIDYLDIEIFNDINILKHDFVHPEYSQLNSDTFIPYLSSLDTLMNVGNRRLKEMMNEQTKL